MHSMFIWEESLKFQFELWPPKTLSGGWFCFHRVANFCRAESAMSTILSGKCAQPHCKVNSFRILHRLSRKLGIDLSNFGRTSKHTTEVEALWYVCFFRQKTYADLSIPWEKQLLQFTPNDKTLFFFFKWGPNVNTTEVAALWYVCFTCQPTFAALFTW